MERFVHWIIAGGVALVVGLWVTALAEAGSSPWLAGLALVFAGSVGLALGAVSELRF